MSEENEMFAAVPMEPAQRRFLLRRLVQGLLTITFPVVLVGLNVRTLTATVLLVLGVVATVLVVYHLGFDLIDGRLLSVCGTVRKRSRRIRGPTHYFIVVNYVEMRVLKHQWVEIDERSKYQVRYSPRSKWALELDVVSQCSHQS
ncbi:MAG: hypothetical protein KDE20_08925 [Caldilineaceae bacterium]|nr:hypothetical protein [Caldilineaceae bacterium]